MNKKTGKKLISNKSPSAQNNRPKKSTATTTTSKAVVPRPNSNRRIVLPKKLQTPAQILSQNYTGRVIEPAKKYDVVSMARAMNPDFGPRVKEIFNPELEAAKLAVQTGIYIGWRCPDFKHDCQRVSPSSRCFCGHALGEHAEFDNKSLRVPCRQGCSCKAFAFIPSRPEEVGEFWLRRRPNYDQLAREWRAKCRCKHTHEEHDPNTRRCKLKSCSCPIFDSNFLCAACDRHWERHETIFESEQDRLDNGFPVGQDYFPFAEVPSLRNMVITGEDNGFDFQDEIEYVSSGGQRGQLGGPPLRPAIEFGDNVGSASVIKKRQIGQNVPALEYARDVPSSSSRNNNDNPFMGSNRSGSNFKPVYD